MHVHVHVHVLSMTIGILRDFAFLTLLLELESLTSKLLLFSALLQ